MKSIAFIFSFLSLFFTSLVMAQTYQLKNWNRYVIIKANGQLAQVDQRFTNINQVTYHGLDPKISLDVKAKLISKDKKGGIYAVIVETSNQGILSSDCGIPNCKASFKIVNPGTQHEVGNAFLSLSDQQINVTTTSANTVKLNTPNSDLNKTNTDRVKLDKANVNVIRQ